MESFQKESSFLKMLERGMRLKLINSLQVSGMDQSERIERDQNFELTDIFPPNLLSVISYFDEINHAHLDSIAVSTLCLMPCLCSGTTVSQEKEMSGRSIILYMLLLAPSGVGKTSVAMLGRKYLLNWLDHDYRQMETGDPSDQKNIIPDVFLDGASAEGLETSFLTGSAPHLVIDEFGKYASTSRNDVLKQNFLRMLMQIYDSGTLVTRKLKDTKNTKLIVIKGMGLFAASTIGKSNLTPQDMRNMISDGLLNRFLVIFGQYKRIPIRQELTHSQAEEVKYFARNFYEAAKDKHFYLNIEAYNIYIRFHEAVNETYLKKYEMQDDTAGLDVRLLTVIQRIAMIFQVCKNVELNCLDQVEIEAISMQRAVRLLEYLDRNHFEQILLYANSKDGRPTVEDRIRQNIQKHGTRSFRDLLRHLHKLKKNVVHPALMRMIANGEVVENEHGSFCLK